MTRTETSDSPPPSPLRIVAICAALALLVAIVFGRVAENGFIDYDDPVYVASNAQVRSGLTFETASWAFRTMQNSNWHPLTWMSHALDVTLFGLDPARHHLVSVALHAANAILLFLAFVAMTGAVWRSAVVAALFAVHPLHVESVAWAAERKDVLSTLFGMGTLLAYARHVTRPTATTRAAVVVLFALGLLAKPMLVTLPFVLLLLDAWPLKRRLPWIRLVKEKIPLFALAAASSAVTWIAQQRGGAVAALEVVPFGARIANAFVAYATYIVQTFRPTSLGVLYPYDPSLPGWKVAASVLMLAAITAGVVAARRRAPFLAVGWLWYVGTLVPVIGLVQVGAQSHADRYTYVPLVGLFVMLAWGWPEILSRRRREVAFWASAGLAVVAIVACSVLTWRQLAYWRDSITLFDRTLEVTEGNYTIHANLGGALIREERLDEAIRHLEEARRLRPDYSAALSNLGLALQGKDRLPEAIALYREALAVKPSHVEAWLNLGNALELSGDLDGAVAAFREAERLRPSEPLIAARIREIRQPAAETAPAARGYFDHGNTLRGRGRIDEAAAAYREAVRLDPTFVDARVNLGIALAIRGETEGASAQFVEALRLRPNDAVAHLNLGVLLAKAGRFVEAVPHFEEVLRLEPDNAVARRALDDARRR